VDARRMWLVGLMAVSVLSVGCLSKSSSNHLLSRSSGGADSTAATAPLDDRRYDELVREMQKNGGQNYFGPAPQTTTQKVTGAFKKAGATVASALTIKPKVDKAPDPLALDNVPKKFPADLCYQAGRLAETNGNPAAAIEQYERGLKDNPKHLPTLISLARLYDRQDHFDKAEQLYAQALEAEPDNAMAHNDLGLCLARHHQSEAALAELRKATKLEPSRKLYRNNLATVLVDLGRIDEASKELKEAHPPAIAHYNLGYLLYQAGNKARAYEEFTAAQKADTSLAAAQQMLNQLDAETRTKEQTQVAMASSATPPPKAPPAAAAPKGAAKVQYRIEDVAPQPTGLEKRVETFPVVHTPSQLRRTPPTDADSASSSLPASDRPLAEPVPLTPADKPAPPTPTDEPGAPATSSEFPIRRMSALQIEDGDDLELPTPAVLEGVAPSHPATK
jgi:Tfp pilus assembly protein PilF